ncbi:hypothetical protein M9H77_11577 [Catharanthus roseus]|uniref:Uncharacterized protein n=1 Tax=Catharanthus roseus TaxID=4058 RepID=A0ACC0BF51_CATRO|nr:hypothetical protein M9H77_11577 [Catharanthus roseus]
MENDPNGEDENDLDSHAKTEGIEFQSNYDCDYKLFFENTRLEGSNVIYQYKNGASVVYDGLIFLNSQTDDNVVSKKQKYTDAIQHETTSKGISYPFPLFWILLSNRSFFNFPSIYCEYFLSNFFFVLVPLLSQKMSKAIVAVHNKQFLKRKIEEAVAANNDLKQLNLLCGFFFWLQDFSLIAWLNVFNMVT